MRFRRLRFSAVSGYVVILFRLLGYVILVQGPLTLEDELGRIYEEAVVISICHLGALSSKD
jgi:hypothetical protein